MKLASLKAWIPNGIVMMKTKAISPAAAYPRASHSPPNSSHRMLPMTRIGLSSTRQVPYGQGYRQPRRPARGRQAFYPTEPSICSSIRRFSSTAYSMGSSRTMGSMKPATIIAVASASERPRVIR